MTRDEAMGRMATLARATPQYFEALAVFVETFPISTDGDEREEIAGGIRELGAFCVATSPDVGIYVPYPE